MSLEADRCFRLVEFGVREGNESKRIFVLIDRLVGVLFNNTRVVVSYKLVDSSQPPIGEENRRIWADALAGSEGAGYGCGSAFCDGEEEVDNSLSSQQRSVAGKFSFEASRRSHGPRVQHEQCNGTVG